MKWSEFSLPDRVAFLAAIGLLIACLGPPPGFDLAGVFARLGAGTPTTVSGALATSPRTPTVQNLLRLGLRSGPGPPRYERAAFGAPWSDVDANGCDTRNDVLQRDLAQVELGADCIVKAGRLQPEPYGGKHVVFQRGGQTSKKVQIDHVVALADAWQSGAWKWEANQRERFANDPLNLLAVAGEENKAKGASAADEWLPPNRGFRCAYVARQIAVKNKWRLSVTAREKLAMARVIATCPHQKMPS